MEPSTGDHLVISGVMGADEGTPHISVSQIKTYLRCPRQYEYRYIRRVEPEFIPRPLAFGIAFHGALSRYYLHVRDFGTPPPVNDLVQTFADLWRQRLDGKIPLQPGDDDNDDPIDLAARMLKAFHRQAALPAGVVVVAVEQPFEVGLHDPGTGEVMPERLVGAIDLVLDEHGRTILVEHKSAARRWSADQLRYDIQPSAYQLAMREMRADQVGLRYQIVTKTKSPLVQVVDVERSALDEDDFRRIAIGVLKAVDAGVSFPLRGWHCGGCPYQRTCSGM
jgi:putative RecB family exonuclease